MSERYDIYGELVIDEDMEGDPYGDHSPSHAHETRFWLWSVDPEKEGEDKTVNHISVYGIDPSRVLHEAHGTLHMMGRVILGGLKIHHVKPEWWPKYWIGRESWESDRLSDDFED